MCTPQYEVRVIGGGALKNMGVVTSCMLSGLVFLFCCSKNSSPEPESETGVQDQDIDEDDDEENVRVEPPSATVTSTIGMFLEAHVRVLQIQKLRSPVLGTQSYQTSPLLNLGDNA